MASDTGGAWIAEDAPLDTDGLLSVEGYEVRVGSLLEDDGVAPFTQVTLDGALLDAYGMPAPMDHQVRVLFTQAGAEALARTILRLEPEGTTGAGRAGRLT